MLHVIAASLLLAFAPSQRSDELAAPPTMSHPVDLGEVIVDGRRIDDLADHFVSEVAAPSQRRGLARWRGGVCVGVANLRADVAQYITDRVSEVARDLGLAAGAPGCHPSIIVVAVSDANRFTPLFVNMRPALFRTGGSGMDRGSGALEAFKTNDQAVRWWTVSAPVDSDTLEIATRLPGMVRGNGVSAGAGGSGPLAYAPILQRRGVSRLSSQVVDDTKRVFVILDVDKTRDVSLTQLADYISLVSLAQIDPEADTSAYNTVLNLFNGAPSAAPAGLTDWDTAYLNGLYDAVRTRQNRRSSALEVVTSIVKAHEKLVGQAGRPSSP